MKLWPKREPDPPWCALVIDGQTVYVWADARDVIAWLNEEVKRFYEQDLAPRVRAFRVRYDQGTIVVKPTGVSAVLFDDQVELDDLEIPKALA